MKRALVTGITGQDGSYLAELLLDKGYEVWGLVRRSSTPNTWRIAHLLDRLHLEYGDMTDATSLMRLVALSRPDEVYNLAAQSDVAASFAFPAYTTDVTGTGAVRLLEAVRLLAPEARFYQASSSELFGNASAPQSETTPHQPCSPYAVAKEAAYRAVVNYRESYGMFAVNGILFNHESPRRGTEFVTRKITLAAARIAADKQSCLYLGNLDARRDWGFAGDYVDGMWRMLQADRPDDYVLATGESHTVREFCELAFERVGIPLVWDQQGFAYCATRGQIVRVDPKLFRPAEVHRLEGDASKAWNRLTWTPRVTFEQLVAMMVDADREALCPG